MKTLKEIRIDIAGGNSPYYVYFLLHSNGIPFYVGKGKSNRICAHETETRSFNRGKRWIGMNTLKINTINKILENGEQVYYEIDSWHETSLSLIHISEPTRPY